MARCRDRYEAHEEDGRFTSKGRLAHQLECPAERHEQILHVVVERAGRLQSLHVPPVGEDDLLAGDDRHHELRHAAFAYGHLTVHGCDEPGAHVFGVTGTRPEIPRTGNPVATVDSFAEPVGEELAARGDAVVVLRENLLEALVRKVGGADRGGRKVGDADPADRPVLPGQLDPRVDHLGEAGLAAAGLFGIGPLHEPALPQRLHHGRSESPALLRGGRLARGQFAQGAGRFNSTDRHGVRHHPLGEHSRPGSS